MPKYTRSTRARLAQTAGSRVRLTRHPLANHARSALPVTLSREARVRLQVLEYARTHPVTVTCRRFGIARSTFYRWRKRFDAQHLSSLERRSCRPRRCRQPTWHPDHVAAVLRLRERYPRWGKAKLQPLLAQQGIVLSGSMVGRILAHLTRRGLLVEPPRHRLRPQSRHPRPYAVRKPKDVQPTQPGDLVQLDTMQLRPLPGVVRYHFTAVDVVSRWNVLGVRATASATTAEAFLTELLARMPFPVRAVQVDGGSEFMADFEQACQARGLALYVLPPRSPKLNGHVERAHRTHRQEFYEGYDGDLDLPVLQQALREWEHVYNHLRPHQALGYQTPAAHVRSSPHACLSHMS